MAHWQPDEPRRGMQALIVIVLTLAGAFAIWRIVTMAWTCDDAFISYRYAKNLVQGHGLVYNPGERVEGYTNFLFTIALAGAMALGAEPRLVSMVLGAAAYLVVAVILVLWSRRAGLKGPSMALPLASGLWLAEDDLHSWATGGLETTVFAALALGGLYVVTRQVLCARDGIAGGLLLGLACLTRPDGLLFACLGVLAPAFMLSRGVDATRHSVLRRTVATACAVCVVLGAFVAFKLSYYGRLFPTAFYAKSASRHYYSQGLFYVALYFMKHWALSLALVALPVAAAFAGRMRAVLLRRDALVALLAFLVFAAYVAHSGGDYMFARRLVPALPFLFVFLDAVAAELAAPVALWTVPCIVLLSYFPNPIYSTEEPEWIRGITDERVRYPEELIALRRQQAQVAHELLAGTHTRIAFAGGMCAFAYYSELPDLVEPNGLTQVWIAEQPLLQRGKIGHEKAPSFGLLREHGVRLIVHHDFPPPNGGEPSFDEIFVGQLMRMQILLYDEPLMSQLAADARVRFKPKDRVLTEALSDLQRMCCADAKASFEVLSQTYFWQHPAGAEPLRRVVEAACGVDSRSASFPPQGR
jgi:hypothetical protein